MNVAMGKQQYRVVFDATVTLSNGSGLTAEAFRVDVRAMIRTWRRLSAR